MMFYITGRYYPRLPSRIPTHFDNRGQINGWGSKESVWLLPATAFVLFVLLSFAHRFPNLMNFPVRVTPENAQRQYDLARTFLRVIKASMLFLFLLLQWMTLSAALGLQTLLNKPGTLIALSCTLIFLPAMVYFYSAFRNR
ncbi:MAG: DUF1648 domain-containing protein [candidate division KSB1 bacterium]|nr:DUF1648 domain-containing protein [candidate division KSB1 bacterium]MDZ7346729.1 DUF1648 domain-containing protein [candidate division KSB1 bacterium]